MGARLFRTKRRNCDPISIVLFGVFGLSSNFLERSRHGDSSPRQGVRGISNSLLPEQPDCDPSVLRACIKFGSTIIAIANSLKYRTDTNISNISAEYLNIRDISHLRPPIRTRTPAHICDERSRYIF